MTRPLRLFLVFLLLAPGTGLAATLPAAVNWDRAEAARVVAQTDTFATREALKQLLVAGDGPGLLALLEETAGREDWPAPARESVLYEFVRDMRPLPPRSVALEVMNFLAVYQSRVMVAHDDHPNAGVAMFDIRAAAHGVQNAWNRQEAALIGSGLLDRDALMLVEAFRANEALSVRQGLLDALDTATSGQLEVVCFLALSSLDAAPELTSLAGRSALLIGDARAIEQLARTGDGPAMSRIMRGAAETLTPGQLARVLQVAVHEGTAQTAALAIAELAPVLAGHDGVVEVLINLLGDPVLGSTAALALAKHPGTATLQWLGSLAAAGDDSLQAMRARMALDINRSQFAGEIRE